MKNLNKHDLINKFNKFINHNIKNLEPLKALMDDPYKNEVDIIDIEYFRNTVFPKSYRIWIDSIILNVLCSTMNDQDMNAIMILWRKYIANIDFKSYDSDDIPKYYNRELHLSNPEDNEDDALINIAMSHYYDYNEGIYDDYDDIPPYEFNDEILENDEWLNI